MTPVTAKSDWVAHSAPMYKRIVVGTDGSNGAARAVQHAAALAKLCGAELHVVTAYKPMSALVAANPEVAAMSAAALSDSDLRDGAAAITSKACEAAPGAVEHQVSGSAADALCDVAEELDADLIVVGSRGLTGARRVLGSVPNSVTHHAKCAVLIVQTN